MLRVSPDNSPLRVVPGSVVDNNNWRRTSQMTERKTDDFQTSGERQEMVYPKRHMGERMIKGDARGCAQTIKHFQPLVKLVGLQRNEYLQVEVVTYPLQGYKAASYDQPGENLGLVGGKDRWLLYWV